MSWFTDFGNGLTSALQNPLFQGGLGLATEGMGGMQKGIQAGAQFSEMNRQQEQRKALEQLMSRPDFGKGIDPRVMQLAQATRDPSMVAQMLMPSEQRASEMHPVQMDLKRAQAEKARREAALGPERYGKDIKVFQGPDGRVYGVQAGANGELKYHDLSAPGGQPAPTGAPGGASPQPQARQPLTPFQKRSVVGDRVFNPATGQFEGSAAEALEGGEIAKGRGDHFAKLETSLPKSRATMEAANAKVDIVRSKIAQAIPMVSNWSVGPGSYLSSLPATQARDLKEVANTIVANMGFDELQEMRSNSPTGGALGQVAVQELEMLQKTKTSLDQAQTVGQYMKALNELKSFYDGAVARRQRAFEETYAPLNRRTGNSPLVTGPVVPRQFTDRLPQGGQPQAGRQGMIPPQAVQLLRGDPTPEIIQQFEAKYGPGSAQQFLGAQ